MISLPTVSAALVDEIALIDVLALSLAIVTTSILWYVVKKAFPDEVKDIQFFLTFIVVIVPFVMLIYFGMAVINYDAMITWFGWPSPLPLTGLVSAPILGAAVFYIGQTLWLWWSWRKVMHAAI